MNSFANSMFTALFGWARGLIQRVWSAAVSGEYSGAVAWLGEHWVLLALVLALAGTAVDFIVWLVRWRPYLAWRTSARRFSRLLREGGSEGRRFKKGYDEVKGLEMPAPEPPPVPVQEAEAEANWEAAWSQPVAAPAETAAPRQPAPLYDLPPAPAVFRASGFKAQEQPTPRRKRRSEKYEKKKPAWAEKLMLREVEEDTLLDGLPPAVDRQAAFHEPVYPRNAPPSQYVNWQPPTEGMHG